MEQKRKIAPGGLLALLLTGLLAGPLMASDLSANYSETFQVSAGDRLELRHGDGDVVIVRSSDDELSVDVRLRGTFERTPDFEVKFAQRGGSISVREVADWGYGSRRFQEYIYEIAVPDGLMLDIEGVDGDVSIEGLEADLILREVDGDVELSELDLGTAEISLADGDAILDDVQGEIEIKTRDGDVVIRDGRMDLTASLGDGDISLVDVEGRLAIRSGDGDISASRIDADNLIAQTRDGDISIDLTTRGLPEIELATGDGDISVSIPGDASVRYELRGEEDGVYVEGDRNAEIGKRGDRAEGQLGSGGGSLTAISGGGEVTLQVR